MITITEYNLCLIHWKPPNVITFVRSQADLVKQMIILAQSNLYSILINCDQDNLITLSKLKHFQ
jgi:hypothetical protein